MYALRSSFELQCLVDAVGLHVASGSWLSEECDFTVVWSPFTVAVAQQFDESGKFCRSKKKQCPDDPSKPYEKYCCIENYGGLAYPVCCSPYFG